MDLDNGTFNSRNTDVVEKVNFLLAASQHWLFGGGRIPSTLTEIAPFGQFSRGILLCGLSRKKIVGFDKNLSVVL